MPGSGRRPDPAARIEARAMRGDGLGDHGMELARLARIEGGQQLAPHAGVPELLQVICDAGEGFGAVRLRLEEVADAVGHVDEVGEVHASGMRWKETEAVPSGASVRRRHT